MTIGILSPSILLLQIPAVPLEDTLLVDLNPETIGVSSEPRMLTSVSGGALFSASVDGVGRELYFTNGTHEPLLFDLDPGGSTSDPSGAVELPNGLVLVAADTNAQGKELWVVDPQAGTSQVLGDLAPGSADSDPTLPVVLGQYAYFLATSSFVRRLWRTDGGSPELVDPTSAFVGDVVHVGLGSLFVTRATLGGKELLRYTGIPGDPPVVIETLELASQPDSNSPGFLLPMEVDGRLVYLARTLAGSGGVAGWYSTDGSVGGSVLLATGTGDWSVAAAGQVFFSSYSPFQFPQIDPLDDRLFVSDGTVTGTFDLTGVSGLGRPSRERPLGTAGELVFAAQVPGSASWRVWSSAGIAGPTLDLAGFEFSQISGPNYLEPSRFTRFGDDVWFVESDYSQSGQTVVSTDARLWRMSLTGGGAQQVPIADPFGNPGELGVGDVTPGLPFSFATTPQGVVFPAVSNAVGSELWTTVGTDTQLLANLDSDFGQSSLPRQFFEHAGRSYFVADRGDDGGGEALFVTDGIPSGTTVLNELLIAGQKADLVRGLEPLGDQAFFVLELVGKGRELWATDGTVAGTHRVSMVAPGFETEPELAGRSAVFGGRLWYAAGQSLWSTNGTPGDVVHELTFDTGPFVQVPDDLSVLDGRLYFSRFTPGSLFTSMESWASTDGTLAGTQLEAFAGPFRFLGTRGDQQVFLARVGTGSDQGLFEFDPQTQLSQTLDTWDPEGSFNIDDVLIEMGEDESIWYAFRSGSSTWTLRVLRPGTAAAVQLGTFNASGSDPIEDITPAGDRMAFLRLSNNNTRLWRSDGTPAGTLQVTDDFSVLDLQSSPPDSTHASPRILIATGNGLSEDGLWTVDLASGETDWLVKVGLFFPPFLTESQYAPRAIRVGEHLMFSGRTGSAGIELHTVPFSLSGGPAVKSFPGGCSESTRLDVGGSLVLGGEATILGSGLLPGSTLYTFVDVSLGPLGVPGACTLSLPLPQFLVQAVGDGFGNAAVSLGLPSNPGLIGLPIFFQAAALDGQGPFLGLASLTNVVEVLPGP